MREESFLFGLLLDCFWIAFGLLLARQMLLAKAFAELGVFPISSGSSFLPVPEASASWILLVVSLLKSCPW